MKINFLKELVLILFVAHVISSDKNGQIDDELEFLNNREFGLGTINRRQDGKILPESSSLGNIADSWLAILPMALPPIFFANYSAKNAKNFGGQDR